MKIDLGKQRAYLLRDNVVILESPVSSGRPGHLTPTGHFFVIQKDLNHLSTLYGQFVSKEDGSVVRRGADSAMPVPKGCTFVRAPMKFFVRFSGAAGTHAGVLPGYPASHGCVRMPASKAEAFYNAVGLDTPVDVFGTPPAREEEEEHHVVHPKAAPSPAPTPKPKAHSFFGIHL